MSNPINKNGGIGLSPVTTLCSILAWRIILAPWHSSRNSSRVKLLAWSIWLRCVGRVALYATIYRGYWNQPDTPLLLIFQSHFAIPTV